MRRFALATVLALPSCPRGQPPQATSRPDTTPVVEAGSSASAVAGFVIVGSGETVIAPVDPRIAVVSAPGIWVLDDAVPTPVVRFFADLREQVPDCVCESEQGACSDGVEIVEAGSGPVCGCMIPPVEPVEPTYLGDDEDDSDVVCESTDRYPAALVGGVLFFHGERHDECEGMNIYDVFSEDEAMVAAPADLAKHTVAVDGCQPDNSTATPEPPWPLPTRGCSAEELAKHEGCEQCWDMQAEADVYLLRLGRLHRVESEMDTAGSGPRRWSSAPVDPAHCPSAADTCGARTHFGDRFDADDDVWIANDGLHALVLDDAKISIVGNGDPVPRGEVGEVLGVRYHADVRPLAAAMTTRAPLAREASACKADAECRGHSGCGDVRCDDGRCVARPAALVGVLAPDDRGFVDKRGGRDWGDRCVKHLRASRLAAAQAACEAGLALAKKPGTRGAILYNLGLVAKQHGDRDTARTRFRESLAVRPGNATVEAALAELD